MEPGKSTKNITFKLEKYILRKCMIRVLEIKNSNLISIDFSIIVIVRTRSQKIQSY